MQKPIQILSLGSWRPMCHPRTESSTLQFTEYVRISSWGVSLANNWAFFTLNTNFPIQNFYVHNWFPRFPHWYWWFSSRLSQPRELWRWEWWPPSLWLLINSGRSSAAATWLKTHGLKAFISLLYFTLAVNIILQWLHSCCFLFKWNPVCVNNEKAHLFS